MVDTWWIICDLWQLGILSHGNGAFMACRMDRDAADDGYMMVTGYTKMGGGLRPGNPLQGSTAEIVACIYPL